MKLRVLDNFFVQKKIKIVSDTTNSFWGQKWSIFAPKTAFLADFGINEDISKMDENWHTLSTFEADKDKNSFGHF